MPKPAMFPFSLPFGGIKEPSMKIFLVASYMGVVRYIILVGVVVWRKGGGWWWLGVCV